MVTDVQTQHQQSGSTVDVDKYLDVNEVDIALVVSLLSHVQPTDVAHTARALLQHCGGIRGLLTLSPAQLTAPQLPDSVTGCVQAAVKLVLRAQQASFHQGMALTSPEFAKEFLVARLGHQEREVFACILMDNQHRVIEYQELFLGTIDGAQVHIREIVRFALSRNAAAVMLVHNHPSGAMEPSQADMRLTRRVRDALALVEVRVVDHLLVAANSVVSLAQRGLI